MSAVPSRSHHRWTRALGAPCALVTLLALVLASPAQAATCPNDGVLQPSEQCDGSAFRNSFGVPSCDTACGAGTVGTVACTNKCKVDCSGCTAAAPDAALPPDSSPPDAFPDVSPPDGWLALDAGPAADGGTFDAAPLPDAATADGGAPPPAGTCRLYVSTPTYFERDSLIIPMDSDMQTLDGFVKAYGLVWHLLKHGIRVAWILDTSKWIPAGTDFTLTHSSLPSEVLMRTGAHDDFDDGGLSGTSLDYRGGPFVIPRADAEAALQLMHHGTLPEDPAVEFGWSMVADFAQVQVHRSKIAFIAPVLRTSSQPPARIALFKDAGWMGEILGLAGLDFSSTLASAGGTPSNPGLIYDSLAASDIAGPGLANGQYQALWMNGDARGAFSNTAHDRIADFVKGGGGIIAAGNAIHELECYDCPDTDCSKGTCSPVTQFQGTTGLLDPVSGHGAAKPPVYGNSPYTQVDTLAYHGLADELNSWVEKSTYRPCAKVLAYNGKGNALISMLDDKSQGPVFYIGGRNYDTGTAWHKVTMQRTVVSWAFLGGDLVQDDHPISREVTRSSPLVVEGDSTSPLLVSYQGTFIWPPPQHNSVFNPASPTSWRFPLVRGNLWAHNLSSLTTGGAFSFFNLPSCWNAADKLQVQNDGTDPTAPPRSIFTSLVGAPLPLSKDPITTAIASALAPRLGLSTSAAATDMINQILVAPLGGIDKSTPALVNPGNRVTFGTPRPTVLYVGGHDGMLHAFQVNDVEAGDPCGGGYELWSWIPPELLGLLKSNDAALQGSPAVADVKVDALDASGAPGSDGVEEWITLLTITSGSRGNTVYALDVSNPRIGDPCPTARPTCRSGPNPLWSSKTLEPMGSQTVTAMGLAKPGTSLTPLVFVTTNDTDNPGLRIFGLKAADGTEAWDDPFFSKYEKEIPGQEVLPDGIPINPALVDKTGSAGHHTHLYIGDLQGRLWEIDTATGKSTQGDNVPIWDAADAFGDGGEARYPIVPPLALYRSDTDNHLHVVLMTGGVYWAPSTSTYRQHLVDIDVSADPPALSWSQQLPIGFRGYAAPIVVNHDVYFSAGSGLVDVLSTWNDTTATGSTFRTNFAGGTPSTTTLGTLGISASTVGVTKSNKVVATTTTGTGVLENPNQDPTSSDPQSEESGNVTARLRLWLPSLRR